MEQFLTYGVVGLSTAAIYAIIGSGLVLTYTTTGVFNFAHGAAGMMAAFAYWQITAGWGLPVWLGLVLVLLVLAPLFGLFVERVIMRPVQHLGEAERLVLTVALLSGLIALARWIWDPNVARPLPAFFADKPPIHIGEATITWHQAVTMIVAVLVAIGLRILLYRSRAGAAMRATVDDRALVGLTGADPVRSNKLAWILGTQLAAIGGILLAPTVQLDASSLSLVIVSAYAAAIFGRLRSLPLTFVGALVLGWMQSYLTGYLPQNAYLPGLRLAAPALLLFAALLVFPHRRLKGRDRQLRRVPVPSIPGTLLFGVCIVVAALALGSILGTSELITYGPIFSLGVVALSYVPLAGYGGQISLCQLSFAGIGAIVWAHLGMHGDLWAIAAAIGISALVGGLIALPALRLSGVYLALGTAAFATVLDQWVFTLPTFHLFGLQISLFNQGALMMSGPHIGGWALTTGMQIMVFSAVCLALVTLVVALLRRSRFGRRLIALRDSESAYATLGGNLLVAKVLVFALSAGIAGLGGALYGMQEQSVTADQFNMVAGLPLFLVAVVGGLGVVGDGMFTGSAYIGPLNAIVAVWPGATNLAALLPSLAGIGIGQNPEGVVPSMRAGWAATARNLPLLGALVALLAGVWGLRYADVINTTTWVVASILVAVIVQNLANARAAAKEKRDEPVEWWGVRRPWRTEDKEVLARGVAGG